jgi:hypothetical protein
MRSGLGSSLLSHPRVAAIVSVVLVALAVTAALAVSAAQAATYTVGTHSDTPRGETCPAPTSGTCSLRQLIEYEDALESAPTKPDVIVLPSGTYELLYGTLTIEQPLLIEGAGARTTIVDIAPEGYKERVFSVASPGENAIVLMGLEIAGGTAAADEGYGNFGGDIRNTGSLLLDEDWVTGGTASAGGGIANVAGTLVLERSLVSGNHATIEAGEGGGIENYGSEECITACGPGKKAVVAVEDSTVAENAATVGAGIFSLTEGGVKDENGVSIINSTIAYNKAEKKSSCVELCEPEPGAGLRATDGTIDVVGSIVAYNSETLSGEYTPSNCSTSGSATIVSLGYNLENEADCGFKSTGDLQATAPDFGSTEPQNNGGNTDTLAPSPTSPAVDAIPTSFSFCDGFDQRDIARPQGAGCDIGAVELVPFTIETSEGVEFSGQLTTASCTVEGTPTVNWGDGQTSKATIMKFSISGTHTYTKAGIYNGSVSYEDDCGSHKFAFQAKVAAINTKPPAPPTPSPPTSVTTAPPTLVTTSPPTVLTTTSAAFTTTVNPDGLETEVHFEYGPVLGGASAASTGTIAYGSVTPDQPVGADFTDHTVTATVTGLLPNVTYNVRAVASNSAGSATGANQTLKTPADPPPPPPVLGKSVNVTPVSGIVYIELPPGATLASASVSPFGPLALGAQALEALTKGQTFVPLTEARQIPVGSVLETTGGVVSLTTATTASKKGKLQTGDFGAGIFKLLQNRKQKGLTDLDMIDNRSASQVCATVGKRGKGRAYAAKLSSKTLGRVNASGHGHFAVRGQYSAATVRGTVWSVTNRCEGTLTHVTRGVVSVRDFVRRKTITLFTGQSYLARGPVKRS